MTRYVTKVGIISQPKKVKKHPPALKSKPDLREAKVRICHSPKEPTTVGGYKTAIRKKTANALKSEKSELEQLMKYMSLDGLKSIYNTVTVTWERRISW